jgi:hypothetical protein
MGGVWSCEEGKSDRLGATDRLLVVVDSGLTQV